MARPKKTVNAPFPIRGISELGSYEDQPNATTPLAQNVRSFAFTGESGDEDKRGRMSGGQRPGLVAYHPFADKKLKVGKVSECTIQDIVHISGHDFDQIVGENSWLMVRHEAESDASGSTALKVWKGHTEDNSLDVPNLNGSGLEGAFTILASTFSRGTGSDLGRHVAWVVVCNPNRTSPSKVTLYRLTRVEGTPSSGNSAWEYDRSEDKNKIDLVDTFYSNAKPECLGISAYGEYVYVWIHDIQGSQNMALASEREGDNGTPVSTFQGVGENYGVDKLFKVYAGEFLSLVEAFGGAGHIHDSKDGTGASSGRGATGHNAVGSRGWDTLKRRSVGTKWTNGDEMADLLMDVSHGTIGMLCMEDKVAGSVILYQKSAETGETISKASLFAGSVSSETYETNSPRTYMVVADKRGDFWVACSTTSDGTPAEMFKSGLFKVERGSSTFTETMLTAGSSVTSTIDSTAPSSDADSEDRAPRSLAYDPVRDIVYVCGKERVCGIAADRYVAAVHANDTDMFFVADNVDESGDYIHNLRAVPFSEGDAVTLTITGTSTTVAGLTGGTTYYVRDVESMSAPSVGLFRFKLSATREGSAINLTAASSKTEYYTLRRSSGERVRINDSNVGKAVELKPGNVVPGSVSDIDQWDVIRISANSGISVAQSNISSGDEGEATVAALTVANIEDADQNLGTTYDIDHEGDLDFVNPFRRMGRNAIENVDPAGRVSGRSTLTLVTGNGTPKKLLEDGFQSISGADYKLVTDAPVIFSAPFGDRVYYVDGKNSIYYDSVHSSDGAVDSFEGSVNDWDVDVYSAEEIGSVATDEILVVTGRGLTNVAVGQSKGKFPKDKFGNKPRLIEVWNRRLVLSGLSGEPQNWWMSRQDDPHDFDYSVLPASDQDAATGTLSPAGLVPDNINSIIPYNDNILIFGCDHSVFQMVGDPAMGASITLLSDSTGMAWGRGWCRDPGGSIYFFGNRGGVYRMAPGSPPTKISSSSIDERLMKINTSERVVRMIWNDREYGFNLFLSHIYPTEQVEHYFYDVRANAWWADKYEAVQKGKYIHNPTSVHIVDGDSPEDREILVGGRNGRVYKISTKAKSDRINLSSTQAIDSFVWIGPFKSRDGRKVVLSELSGLIAKDSDNVSYDVFVGRSAEDIVDTAKDSIDAGSSDSTALSQMKKISGAFSPNRTRESAGAVDRRRAVSHELFVRLRNSSNEQDWAFEKLDVVMSSAGLGSRRSSETGQNA